MFTLDPNTGLPIYRQLIEQIRRMVASNQLGPGDPLPSVRELALAHAVNPMTISKAYSLLEAEGILERQRGRGMVISQAQRQKENKHARLERLQPAITQLAMAARQLELPAEEVLKAVQAAMTEQETSHD